MSSSSGGGSGTGGMGTGGAPACSGADTTIEEINKGNVLCQGPPDEVKSHPEVRRIYLGDIDADENGPPPPHMLKRRDERGRRRSTDQRRRLK